MNKHIRNVLLVQSNTQHQPNHQYNSKYKEYSEEASSTPIKRFLLSFDWDTHYAENLKNRERMKYQNTKHKTKVKNQNSAAPTPSIKTHKECPIYTIPEERGVDRVFEECVILKEIEKLQIIN